MDGGGRGTCGLIGSQARREDDAQLLVDKGQGVAEQRVIGVDSQALRDLHGCDRHLGLMDQQLGHIRSGRVDADQLRRLLIHLHTVRRRRAVESIGKGSFTGRKFEDGARRRVHIDCRRLTKLEKVRQIVAQHLGRSIGDGRMANACRAPGKRIILFAEGARRPEVDQAQIERAFLCLLLNGKVGGADHDVRRRDIAMDESAVHIAHAHEQAEQVAPDARGRQRRQATIVIDRQAIPGIGERLALDPFHDDGGCPVYLAPSVQARKPLESGKRLMGLVFLAKRSRKLLDVDGVICGDHRLDCERLALDVRRADNPPQPTATGR